MDQIFKLIDRYRGRIKSVGIEVTAFQKMLKYAFEVEMRKRNKWIKVVELRHTKSKEERILSLQPRYETGAVYHKAWMKEGELEEEILRFPKGRHDDLADAAAALLELVPARSNMGPRRTREKPPEDYLQRLIWKRRQHEKRKTRDRASGGYVHDTLGGIF